MSSIGSFSGIASGIQWRDMIDQIMFLEARRRVTPITNRISTENLRRTAWNDFSGVLSKLSTASASLKDGTGFGKFTINVPKGSNDTTLFTATASSSAAPGTYGVEVRALAKNEKLRTVTSYTSTTTALSLSGTFHVNGRAVTLDTADSLASIRDKINAVNAGSNPSGVTASIVTVSETEHYLSLTADGTGTRGIELIDSGDGTSANGVLAQLGVLDGTQSANTKAGDATRHQTQRFTSKTTAVAQLLGLSAPPATASIVVDGTKVAIDLETDSLQDILDKIDAATGGATTSSFVTEEVNGTTMYRLETGVVTVDKQGQTPRPESQRVLELLGLVKGNAADQVQAGADAEVAIDGLTVTRRKNEISDVLAGVTLNLEAAEIGKVVDMSISRDLDGVTAEVQGFVDAFNSMMEFYEKQSRAGAPLHANGSLRAAILSFRNVLLNNVPGIDPATTEFTRTTIAGVSFNREGRLELDSETLKNSLSSNFAEVKRLFNTVGTATNSAVSYVGATDSTTPGTYAVDITQIATMASATGGSWTTNYNGNGPDQMTVVDAYTGTTSVISLVNGDNIDTVIAKLNDQFDANGATLTASKGANSELIITGSKYGSAGSFTVSYQEAGVDSTAAPPTNLNAGTYAGLDVAGTIGGEAATGVGQVLTAADGTTADGLSLIYTGTSTGAQGTITYSRGVAGELERITQSYVDETDGIITRHMETIDSSILRLEDRQLNAQQRLERYEEQLIRQFTAMEKALGQLQSQGNWLSAQITSLQNFNLAASR